MAHWYLPTGETFYTVPLKTGKGIREANIKDAKKVKAGTSSTTIIGQIGKPNLLRWQLDKMLNAAWNNTTLRLPLNKWKALVNHDYKKETEQYAKEGTKYHDAFEEWYKEGNVKPTYRKIIIPAVEYLENKFKEYGIIKYRPEESFFCAKGYGGKIDLIIETQQGLIIIDFKTKQKEEVTEKDVWFDYCMQLASYKQMVGKNKVIECGNLIVSTSVPNMFHFREWTEEELEKGEKMFNLLLEYWKLSNNYDPSIN